MSEGVYVINFLVWWLGLSGRRLPPRPSCLVKYNNLLLLKWLNDIALHVKPISKLRSGDISYYNWSFLPALLSPWGSALLGK